MHPQIKDRKQRIDELIVDMSLDDETVQSVREEQRRIADQFLAVTGRNSRIQYLRDYIQRQFDRATAETAEDLDGGQPREEPLCDCSDHRCDLKAGKLPSRVRMADDPFAGIDRFAEQHMGHPAVLVEAREQYRQAEQTVFTSLGDCVTSLRRDQPVYDIRGNAASD